MALFARSNSSPTAPRLARLAHFPTLSPLPPPTPPNSLTHLCLHALDPPHPTRTAVMPHHAPLSVPLSTHLSCPLSCSVPCLLAGHCLPSLVAPFGATRVTVSQSVSAGGPPLPLAARSASRALALLSSASRPVHAAVAREFRCCGAWPNHPTALWLDETTHVRTCPTAHCPGARPPQQPGSRPGASSPPCHAQPSPADHAVQTRRRTSQLAAPRPACIRTNTGIKRVLERRAALPPCLVDGLHRCQRGQAAALQHGMQLRNQLGRARKAARLRLRSQSQSAPARCTSNAAAAAHTRWPFTSSDHLDAKPAASSTSMPTCSTPSDPQRM